MGGASKWFHRHVLDAVLHDPPPLLATLSLTLSAIFVLGYVTAQYRVSECCVMFVLGLGYVTAQCRVSECCVMFVLGYLTAQNKASVVRCWCWVMSPLSTG